MSGKPTAPPLLDPADVIEQPAARDTLEGSLDVESQVALTKKKSWFGSLRHAVQKGALQAKAAVDSIRGDHIKPES